MWTPLELTNCPYFKAGQCIAQCPICRLSWCIGGRKGSHGAANKPHDAIEGVEGGRVALLDGFPHCGQGCTHEEDLSDWHRKAPAEVMPHCTRHLYSVWPGIRFIMPPGISNQIYVIYELSKHCIAWWVVHSNRPTNWHSWGLGWRDSTSTYHMGTMAPCRGESWMIMVTNVSTILHKKGSACLTLQNQPKSSLNPFRFKKAGSPSKECNTLSPCSSSQNQQTLLMWYNTKGWDSPQCCC